MNVFEKAKWIWQNEAPEPDEYAEFAGAFFAKEKNLVFRLSVDSDYTLFINGKFAASGQYGDFENNYKIYDEIALSDCLQDGENEFSLLVWYFGENTQRYKIGKAGAIFEIVNGRGESVFQSDETVLCRLAPSYVSHEQKKITGQLGFSFSFDANQAETPYAPAVAVEKPRVFYPRPIKKSELLPVKYAREFKRTENGRVFDLGEEVVGLVTFSFTSDKAQTVTVSWGEDYPIRRLIDGRDFSFTYVAKAGANEYTNYMLRVAARYICVEGELSDLKIGFIPQVYPVRAVETPWIVGEDRKIYDVCVNTLKLCMMEHYVDCPWREQCLYAFDSRNQMLCGYYAFEGGNFDYARANLLLMSKDERADGLMSICYPCGVDLTIPSFSLYYLLSVNEYTEYSGDLTLAKEVFAKLSEILETFMRNSENGLVCKFEGSNHWNFYDWSSYLDGNLGGTEEKEPDLVINALMVIALDSFEKICKKIGEPFPYKGIAENIRKIAAVKFSANERGMVTMTEGKDEYTELAASLAILSGIASGAQAEYLCEQMQKGALTPCSLSMKTFKYDAYLKTDEAKYKELVLGEIRRDYGFMLGSGAQTVWETIDGAKAFGNAGSLCHGWSAIPVYYFHKFK